MSETNNSNSATCSLLVWTSDLPTCDGWYWYRGGDSYGWWEGCVEVDLKDQQYFFEGDWKELDDLLPDSEWSSQPIKEPTERANKEITNP